MISWFRQLNAMSLHKIANESHDTKTNGDCLAYLRNSDAKALRRSKNID
jgi:hypothetical protein